MTKAVGHPPGSASDDSLGRRVSPAVSATVATMAATLIARHGLAIQPNEAARYAMEMYAAGVASRWIATCDRLPEKPGLEAYEYVDCLIFYKGDVLKRPWNCEHLCWDDEHYDDHFCDPKAPSHWMPQPAPPVTA